MNVSNEWQQVEKLTDMQCLLYELLAAFHKFCEDNHLYYSVFGGTLLGAVRHKAFIPWDDDVDVCMPRPDYDKFISLMSEQQGPYCVQCFPQKDYAYPFAKFCMRDTLLVEDLRDRYAKTMLYIDVFPVDGYPDTQNEKKHFDRLRRLKKSRYSSVCKVEPSDVVWKKPFVIVRFLYITLFRIIGCQHYLKKEIAENKRYSYINSEYCCMQGAGWNERGKLKKSVFEERRLYPFGPKLKVYGISDYHEHLTRLYGDYMVLPSEEKRVSNHHSVLYIKKKV